MCLIFCLIYRCIYMVGENEKVYSVQKALKRIHRIAPRIKTVLAPGAGHDMPGAHPEFIMEKILEFLGSQVCIIFNLTNVCQ